jgi:hypothetical protein
MNRMDYLYKASEIKKQFGILHDKCQAFLPKVQPYLVYDLLLRQQRNPSIMYMYNIEVFTRQATHANAATGYTYKKTDIVPAVYDKGTHYVTNQKLTLDMLKEISERKEVLQVTGEYTGCCLASMDASTVLGNQEYCYNCSFYG